MQEVLCQYLMTSCEYDSSHTLKMLPIYPHAEGAPPNPHDSMQCLMAALNQASVQLGSK